MQSKPSVPFDSASMDLLSTALAEPGYGVFPDLLTTEFQRGLIELMKEKLAADQLVRAGVGAGGEKKIRSEIRSDSIFWLEEDDKAPVAEAWIEGMNGLCEYFRRHLFLSLWSYEGHLAQYPAEGFYKAHLDQHAQTLARQVSVIAYLNEDWSESDGGTLRLYTDMEKGVNGPFIDILPKAGTVVIFRSADFWHEVLPSKRTRLSLTGWLRGREELPIRV
ncbi:2OG-Fe(II) oxygenase [Rubritalea sp.]|uniref:2OG-Fe(II) oxygenase n=1 Tax=Rubritalea sp. TaxID=2109375 RepID=UPI003EF3E7CB